MWWLGVKQAKHNLGFIGLVQNAPSGSLNPVLWMLSNSLLTQVGDRHCAIDPLTRLHYADLKPLFNSYIQHLNQIMWDVSVHGRDRYLLEPTLGPPNKFQYLARVEEFVFTNWSYFGHKVPHLLTPCLHCGQTLIIDHMLLECAVLQETRGEYYTAGSLKTLFETILEICIVKFYSLWY